MLSMCFIPCWLFSDFLLLCLVWSFHWVLKCAFNYQVATALRRTLNKIRRRQVYTASLPLSSTATRTEVVCISKQMSLWLTNRCITVLVNFAQHESYFCACKWCFQLLLLFFQRGFEFPNYTANTYSRKWLWFGALGFLLFIVIVTVIDLGSSCTASEFDGSWATEEGVEHCSPLNVRLLWNIYWTGWENCKTIRITLTFWIWFLFVCLFCQLLFTVLNYCFEISRNRMNTVVQMSIRKQNAWTSCHSDESLFSTFPYIITFELSGSPFTSLQGYVWRGSF